jgi:hypothetical protein
MAKDPGFQLRYLGMMPQDGHREYGFHVEDKDHGTRQVVLTIEDAVFLEHRLMFQEAPDLCYQKMLMDLVSETAETRVGNRVSVNSSDITRYRDGHPTAGPRNRIGHKRPSSG